MLALVPCICQKHLTQFQIFESILLTRGEFKAVATYSGKLIVAHLLWITYLLLSFLPTPPTLLISLQCGL